MLILTSVSIASAEPHIEWIKTYDEYGAQNFWVLPDGGYLIVYDNILLKTDSNGNEEWSIEIICDYKLPVSNSIETPDGGLATLDCKNIFEYGYDIFVKKIDSRGIVEWELNFVKNIYGTYTLKVSDTEYLVLGDDWLMKIDSENNVEWYKEYNFVSESTGISENTEKGVEDFEKYDGKSEFYEYSFYKLIEVEDGYLITGSARKYGESLHRPLLVKTDKEGNEEWHATYMAGCYVVSVLESSDSGYILWGHGASLEHPLYGPYRDDYDICIIRVDSDGSEVQSSIFGCNYDDDGILSILDGVYGEPVQNTSDGGFILTGTTFCYDTENGDALLIKTDEDGDVEWNMTIVVGEGENVGDEAGITVRQLDDGSYAVLGIIEYQNYREDRDRYDSFLVKLEENKEPFVSIADILTKIREMPIEDKKASHRINKAIAHLNKSHDYKFWVDFSHLDPKRGKNVFDNLKQAVKNLQKTGDLEGIVREIVNVSRTLSKVAVEEASRLTVSNTRFDRELNMALSEFSGGLQAFAGGDYIKAIEHFKKAWKHSMKAEKLAEN